MNQNNRTDKRLRLQKECILVNELGLIETQTVDVSKMGLGLKTDSTLPFTFKNGCELGVLIPSMDNLPPAKLMWTMKDFNNTTRLGLEFQLPFPHFFFFQA
jgi:hypothetical protein